MRVGRGGKGGRRKTEEGERETERDGREVVSLNFEGVVERITQCSGWCPSRHTVDVAAGPRWFTRHTNTGVRVIFSVQLPCLGGGCVVRSVVMMAQSEADGINYTQDKERVDLVIVVPGCVLMFTGRLSVRSIQSRYRCCMVQFACHF